MPMPKVILANGERALLDLEYCRPIEDVLHPVLALCGANQSMQELKTCIVEQSFEPHMIIICDSFAMMEEPPTLECLFRKEEPKSDKSFHKFTQTPWKRKKKGNRR